MNSNMAPGSEDDPRSGVHDEFIDCPECSDCDPRCYYCNGEGIVSKTQYNNIKELEKEETEANQ